MSFSVPDPSVFINGAISSAASNATAMTAKMVKDVNLEAKLEVATQKF